MTVEDNRATIRRYRDIGLWGGLFLGLLIGVLVGGPQYREWQNPLGTWATLLTACAAVGGITGYLFTCLMTSGTGPSPNDTSDHPGDGDGGGGDGGGGD